MCGDGLIVHIHWGRAGPGLTPQQAVFLSTTYPFRPPSCGNGASSWLVKERKKRNPGMQLPLLLLLFGFAHTLFPLWRSYSCRGVCVGLPLIHRSSFTFWETWGWASNWHRTFFFCQWMWRAASRRPFSMLPIDSSVQVPRSATVEPQIREDSGLERRWKMRSSHGGENESQEKQRGLFTSSSPAWHFSRPIVSKVLQCESRQDYEHQGKCLRNYLVMP